VEENEGGGQEASAIRGLLGLSGQDPGTCWTPGQPGRELLNCALEKHSFLHPGGGLGAKLLRGIESSQTPPRAPPDGATAGTSGISGGHS
jgi:hypothetical protein